MSAKFKIAAFYKFVRVEDYRQLREWIEQQLSDRRILGTCLLAEEGINGTLAGVPEDLDEAFTRIRQDPRFADLELKISWAGKMPFHRLKVQARREIVTLAEPEADPLKTVGQYVEPEEWNSLISDPDVLLIDTRNDYEVEVGTFEGAENPHTASFRDFPQYAAENIDPAKTKKVAMFCTGGIRCEKATAHLLNLGVEHVFHLKGGILNYLERVPAEHSKWRGDCFIFDNRVTLTHELQRGDYVICGGCRRPVGPEDRQHADYESGVSCPRCRSSLSDEKIAALRERRKQHQLSRQRGEHYYGQPDQVTKFAPEDFDEGLAE